MAYVYRSGDLRPFIDGIADFENGPSGGVMPHRVPQKMRVQIPDPWGRWNEACPVGVHIALHAASPATLEFMGYELNAGDDHRVVVVTHSGGNLRFRDYHIENCGRLALDAANTESLSISFRPGRPTRLELDPAQSDDGDFTVILPHTCMVELLRIESEREVLPLRVPAVRLRWVHYGSSISHGEQVRNPARRWPEQVAWSLGLHLRDYSLSGNAQMDQAMARTIGDTKADVITCAIGINVVNADSMRERFFIPALHGFLDTIRERQPQTPLVLVTACSCPLQEQTPGPVFTGEDDKFHVASRHVKPDDGALTLVRTRELITQVAQRRNDQNLVVADGRRFFGPDDAELLDDNLHPNLTGIDLIARRVTPAFADMLDKRFGLSVGTA
ncbi:GDSL-type esterase/lipase family protein [Bifidobacterium sp. ESL0764]|uniref:GDSL-type esterase/lipase family protein n=1 Tax=Bifidobacterium sp. ESL0764 TaxID=2983228 RepID=UPI0023F8CB7A|nr:GDSL-type esterase/lipase family protein [Bifidobacterium sp. ESL0764]WEV65207.1 GDSL-type esterase/lipase family protein [Bifidobacterium sp. ESL0764]